MNKSMKNSDIRNADSFLDYLSVCRIAAHFGQRKDANEINDLKSQGLEIAEIRIDMAGTKDHVEARQLINAYEALPMILTVRTKEEGGYWDGNETDRLALIESLLPLCAAVDIELASDIFPQVVKAANKHDKAIIASRHNLTVADSLSKIEEFAATAYEAGAHIYKQSHIVNNEDALITLQDFTDKWQEDNCVIVTGMGNNEYARESRLTLPQIGSRIAFANVEKGESAIGQLSLEETRKTIKTESPRSIAAQPLEHRLY